MRQLHDLDLARITTLPEDRQVPELRRIKRLVRPHDWSPLLPNTGNLPFPHQGESKEWCPENSINT